MKIEALVMEILLQGLCILLLTSTNLAKIHYQAEKLSKFKKLLLGHLSETLVYYIAKKIVNDKYFKHNFQIHL